MSIDKIKFVFSIVLSLLLGLVCEIIAPTSGARNWISFIVASFSLMALIIPALGLNYDNAKRSISIKIVACIFSLVILFVSICFACTEYKIDIYIAISLLVAVLGWVIIYSLLRAK